MKARAAVIGVTSSLLVAAFGCQLIVGSDPGAFSCEEGKTATCPAGQFCSGGMCVAGTATDTVVVPPVEDRDTPDTFVPEVDAKADAADSGLSQPGSPCRLDKECGSGLCGTEGILGAPALTTGAVCTSTCCTSSQCPRGFVCLAPGTGGSYCVAASALPERQVPSTGGASGGAACTANTECRSGLCGDVNDGGVRRCIDNCCKAADCASGTCAVGTIAGKYTGFVCTEPKGNFNVGTACTTASQCKTNLCYNTTAGSCRQRCCSSSQCGTGNSCIWDTVGDPVGVVDFCFPTGLRKAAGETCVDFADCASTHCELESNALADAAPGRKVCRELCCADSDCAPSQKCLPAPDQPRVLRCVPR